MRQLLTISFLLLSTTLIAECKCNNCLCSPDSHCGCMAVSTKDQKPEESLPEGHGSAKVSSEENTHKE